MNLTLWLAGACVAVMQTITVPVLPDVPSLFGVTAEDASWLITGTLVASAVATPSITRLADMFGKRRLMFVSLIVMISGSVLGATTSTLPLAITARALQGVGISLIPVGISIMRDELPRQKLASSVALMSAMMGVGSAVALPLAGVIYTAFGWHSLFWFSAAIGTAMLLAVFLFVPESRVRSGGRFDYVGSILLSVALVTLLLGITKGGHWGWQSRPTWLMFVLAFVTFAIWAPYELRTSRPLVDLRTLSRRPVLFTNIATYLASFAMYVNLLSTTQLLESPRSTGYGFGLTAAQAGLLLLPGAATMVAFAPVSAVITRRYGPKCTMIIGALTIAAGYFLRLFFMTESWQVLVTAMVVSAGTSISYSATPILIMKAVPATETAAANGLNTVLRGVGQATSSAVIAAILTSSMIVIGGDKFAAGGSFAHIFFIAGVAALLAAGAALLLPARQAPAWLDVRGRAEPDVSGDIGVGRIGPDPEIVSHGSVVDSRGRHVANAILRVARLDGVHVDWGRTDADGRYSIALPGDGSYLVVAWASGWQPSSQVVAFGADAEAEPVRLQQRLSVSGRIQASGEPCAGFLISLAQAAGESVTTGTSDEEGAFELPLPRAGSYVLTAFDPASCRSRSWRLILAPQRLDLECDFDAGVSNRSSG